MRAQSKPQNMVTGLKYLPDTGSLKILLQDRKTAITLPLSDLPDFAELSASKLSKLKLSADGLGVIIPGRPQPIQLAEMISAYPVMLSIMKMVAGYSAGSAKSIPKTMSSRANGLKGGRPPRMSAGDMVGAVTFAKRLGITGAELKAKERAGEVFSVIRGTRTSRVYPVFQADPRIVGAPIQTAMAALRESYAFYDEVPAGPAFFFFFTGVTDLLENLCVLEILTGEIAGNLETRRPLTRYSHKIVKYPADKRMEMVVDYAKAYSASLGQ